MKAASLAYGRVTGQFARKDDDPTIEQDAVTLAAEVQRLVAIVDNLRSADKQMIDAFYDLAGMIERREYR